MFLELFLGRFLTLSLPLLLLFSMEDALKQLGMRDTGYCGYVIGDPHLISNASWNSLTPMTNSLDEASL